MELTVFEDHAFHCTQHHRRHVPLGRHQRVAPHGFHFAGVESGQRQLYSPLVVEWSDLREKPARFIVTHDNLVAQSFD